ncbi:hypothetical protein BDK51DRAFT_31666 [Blyttiomyces helicus]|uniref:Uncharacterized protein n=1 Tax=Blyttiomyces helicus TaxID=388810 RepID=A0A4P9VWE6_9FUNG|nr:hypothetical protein BDK51DRAFT_31666 [Blyttiomyces helicus]|eukprot:RKO84029.1 hypothetical protein BDK51DRAFT_31666 [Blyttiomyces helicus]
MLERKRGDNGARKGKTVSFSDVTEQIPPPDSDLYDEDDDENDHDDDEDDRDGAWDAGDDCGGAECGVGATGDEGGILPIDGDGGGVEDRDVGDEGVRLRAARCENDTDAPPLCDPSRADVKRRRAPRRAFRARVGTAWRKVNDLVSFVKTF